MKDTYTKYKRMLLVEIPNFSPIFVQTPKTWCSTEYFNFNVFDMALGQKTEC